MPQSSLGTQTENDQGPPRFTEVSISQAPRLSFSNTTMGLICILVTDIYRTCKTKGCGEKIKYTVRDKAQTERKGGRERGRERENMNLNTYLGFGVADMFLHKVWLDKALRALLLQTPLNEQLQLLKQAGVKHKESNLWHVQCFVPEIWWLKGLRQVKQKASHDFKGTSAFDRLLAGTPLWGT